MFGVESFVKEGFIYWFFSW